MSEFELDVAERAEGIVDLATRQWVDALERGELDRAQSFSLIAVAVARFAESQDPAARSRW